MLFVCYLVDKDIVEMIGKTASKCVSQLSKKELLLLHCQKLVMTFVQTGIVTKCDIFQQLVICWVT